LNEGETLAAVIERAQLGLANAGVAGEIVVADNGSLDQSRDIAEALGARVVAVPTRGYGAALSGGIAAAEGEYVVMGDADGSYDFATIPSFLEHLQAGADVVVGNRFEGGIEEGAMPFLHRYLGNPVLSVIGRRLFTTGCGDVYCGLRGFRAEAVRSLDLRSRGMEYAIEMIVKATLDGLRVDEIPITLHPDGRSGKTHLRTWRDGWRSLRLLLLYNPRWLFLYPGLGVTALGLAALLWLLPAKRAVGGVVLDVHTLFYAATAIVVGLQAVIFAVLANAFAVAEGLLPPAARLRAPARWFTLDLAFAAGVVLVLVGLGSGIAALLIWDGQSFGALSYSHTMRFVIPSGIAFMLGSELILGGFLMSLFELRRR
jgi:hypothetical protein